MTSSTSSTTPSSTPIVLITGGSRGLGRSAALAAARSGIDVVLTYRQQAAEAQAVVAKIEALGRRAVALPLDVGDVTALAPLPRNSPRPCTPIGSASALTSW